MGELKTREWKTQDLKTRDQISRVKNAGPPSMEREMYKYKKTLQSSEETDSRTTQLRELAEINAKCQNRRRTMLMSARQIGKPLIIRSWCRIHASQNR